VAAPLFSSVGEGRLDTLRLVQDAFLVAFVVTIIVTDWRSRRIPNVVTYPTMVIGLVLGVAESASGAGFPGMVFSGGILDHVGGLVIGFLLSYPFYAGGGLKAGDGKFLMAVGALKGTLFLLQAAAWGALIGGVIALVFIVARRLAALRRGEKTTLGTILHTWIPYGVALGMGALVALVLELRRIS
jgi:prepilin peptidase CpaA